MKYIVFGDTGGHLYQLHKALLEIGMTNDFILPDDVKVIHLGDLVHKGLYSTQLLQMIEKIRLKNPNRWIQLIGNHEAQYLGGYQFWDKRIDDAGRGILTKWYNQNFLKFIYTINTPTATVVMEDEDYELNDSIVFSHAGISLPFWVEFLSNTNSSNFETIFNELALNDVHKPGLMLGASFNINSPVGPVWAHGINEVWAMWRKFDNIPFNQMVGHIAPYQYEKKAYYPGTLEIFKESAHLHEAERAVVSPLNMANDKWMFFMDPGYAKNAYSEIQPYLLITTQE